MQDASFGVFHTAAIVGKKLWCWGGNGFNQLGDSDNPKVKTQQDKPILVKVPPEAKELRRVYCGDIFTVIEDIENRFWVRGFIQNGMLGCGFVAQKMPKWTEIDLKKDLPEEFWTKKIIDLRFTEKNCSLLIE